MTDPWDQNGNHVDTSEPGTSPGITLVELAVIVLGAAIGSWPLYEVFDLVQTAWQRTLGVVLFALTGVLMVGPIVLFVRLMRRAPVGPGEIVWTILGTTLAPLFWIGTWLLHAETPVPASILSLVHPAMTDGWQLAVLVVAVGTGLAVFLRSRTHPFSWLGLVLGWAWVACMFLATVLE